MVPFLNFAIQKSIMIMYLVLLLLSHLISLWKCRRTSLHRRIRADLLVGFHCGFHVFFFWCPLRFVRAKGVSLFAIRYVGYVNALKWWNSVSRQCENESGNCIIKLQLSVHISCNRIFLWSCAHFLTTIYPSHTKEGRRFYFIASPEDTNHL